MTAVIQGDDNDNTLLGSGDDHVWGMDGNDRLIGGYQLSGGNGNDTLDGGNEDDLLYGGADDDVLSGGSGNDIIRPYGGISKPGSLSEFDKITDSDGSDLFDLRDGNGNPAYLKDDRLDGATPKGFALITAFEPDLDTGKGDKIQLQGSASEYRIMPVFWEQTFNREPGNEIITADRVNVALVYVGKEQDQQDVVAVLQDIRIQTVSDSARLLSNPNAFVFDPNYVHPQPNRVRDPRVPTEPPTDSFKTITGTPGVDNLQGTAEADLILGLGSKDAIAGGAGCDTLVGGAGRDTLSGGTDADLFVLSALSDKGDRIIDFNQRLGDRLVFDLDGFAGLKAEGLQSNQFVKGKKALDQSDRLIYDQRKGKLFYDSDGIGSSKAVEIATFANKPALTASSILVSESPF
ncbi:MAG TPA: hypothetical protein V6C84_15075 [Coleofasciculaceae cyanobacterium]|jgi:Ca2+-binding RTX toxin-like protein